MLLSLGLMAIAGFCAKAVDEMTERKLGIPALWPILLAAVYGLTMGWLASQTLLGPLLLALAAASLLAGKIDHQYHLVGAVCFAAMFIALPLIDFMPWWFALFLLSGLLDELGLGGKERGPLAWLNRERMWTPIAALAAWLFFGGSPLFVLAIVAFDLSYRFGRWCMELRFPLHAAGASAKTRRRKGR